MKEGLKLRQNQSKEVLHLSSAKQNVGCEWSNLDARNRFSVFSYRLRKLSQIQLYFVFRGTFWGIIEFREKFTHTNQLLNLKQWSLSGHQERSLQSKSVQRLRSERTPINSDVKFAQQNSDRTCRISTNPRRSPLTHQAAHTLHAHPL